MISDISSLSRYNAAVASTMQVQKVAQKLPQAQVQQLLQPIQQRSGADSASFSAEAVAKLAAEEAQACES